MTTINPTALAELQKAPKSPVPGTGAGAGRPLERTTAGGSGRLPAHIERMLSDAVVEGTRSERSHALVAACVEWGLDDGEVVAVAGEHRPTVAKAQESKRDVAALVAYSLEKLRPLHHHIGRPCDKAGCPSTPKWMNGEKETTFTASSAPAHVDRETGEVLTVSSAVNLPEEFWQARPELDHIRRAAHATYCSADAVLGWVLARVAAATSPLVRLPVTSKPFGTLNYAVANVGPPGSSKTSAGDTAEELVALPADVPTPNLGSSGEGIAEAYMGEVEELDDNGKTRRVRRQVRTSALFTLDEGQKLAKFGGRKGSTALEELRTAWSGHQLGGQNGSKETTRLVPKGEYRFVAVIGFQSTYAAELLDDAAGGTPHRFVWLSAIDRLPDEDPVWPGPLRWRPPTVAAGPMGIDPAIVAEVKAHQKAVTRGEIVVDALDQHRELVRIKTASLLALLAGRGDVNGDDWRLAGIILDTSARVRGSVLADAKARAAAAEKAAEDRHVRRKIAEETSTDDRALDVMVKAVARHVHKHQGDCGRRCVSRATPSKYRSVVTVDEAIDEAAVRGWVQVDGDIIRPGDGRPT